MSSDLLKAGMVVTIQTGKDLNYCNGMTLACVDEAESKATRFLVVDAGSGKIGLKAGTHVCHQGFVNVPCTKGVTPHEMTREDSLPDPFAEHIPDYAKLSVSNIPGGTGKHHLNSPSN